MNAITPPKVSLAFVLKNKCILSATDKTSTFPQINTILESKNFHVKKPLLLLSCKRDISAIYLAPLQSLHHYVPKDEGIFLQSSQVGLAWRLREEQIQLTLKLNKGYKTVNSPYFSLVLVSKNSC